MAEKTEEHHSLRFLLKFHEEKPRTSFYSHSTMARDRRRQLVNESKQAFSRGLTHSVRSVRATKLKERAQKIGNVLTRSGAFRKLVDWAYSVCDSNRTGHINKDELYAGLLLVHVKLAKFAGPAACFPPSKRVVSDLFEASDADHSGGICRQEFNIILSVCCAQIFSRILLNYATMIFVIPFVARKIVERWNVPEGSYMELVCEQFAGLFIFLLLVPILWNRIDREANRVAGSEAERQRSFRGLDNDGHFPQRKNNHQKQQKYHNHDGEIISAASSSEETCPALSHDEYHVVLNDKKVK